MELEFQQLELRYETLRVRRPITERRLLASLAQVGQQVPIVVVAGDHPDRFVVVDGFKRIRALRQLRRDTARAMRWDVDEAEALLLDRLMRTASGESVLEQGWLLRELNLRFDLSLDDLARRFDRSVSWISRRLALVRELPEEIQEHVRRGEVVAHAAMKYLVPLARANKEACAQLVAGIAGKDVSSRQVGALYMAWRDGIPSTRERVIEAPLLFLRAREETVGGAKGDEGAALLGDLDLLGGVARRILRRLREGVLDRLLPPERGEAARCFEQARAEVDRIVSKMGKEAKDAGPGQPSDSADASRQGS